MIDMVLTSLDRLTVVAIDKGAAAGTGDAALSPGPRQSWRGKASAEPAQVKCRTWHHPRLLEDGALSWFQLG